MLTGKFESKKELLNRLFSLRLNSLAKTMQNKCDESWLQLPQCYVPVQRLRKTK